MDTMKIFGPIPGPTTLTIEEYARYEIEFEKLYLSMKTKNELDYGFRFESPK